MWKGDIHGLCLMHGEAVVATLRPCRRFIHGRLVRKVMQRFDELDVSDDVIDRVGLNAIIGEFTSFCTSDLEAETCSTATFTVITTARQRRFGIVPRRASVPDSSDSGSIGSSVEYEDSDREALRQDDSDLVEPNDSDYDSQYESEDPDAPSPHYSPPNTSHGVPTRAAYSFMPATNSAAPADDTTPRPHQSGFDVAPESRRPSAQSGVNVGFENDFNPNTVPGSTPAKGSSTRTKSTGKSRSKDKQRGDILGPLPSALASLGLGIRSGRRRSAADPTHATEESEQKLKKWGRSRGLSF
jgi:hypothetical protein